ncbi:putative gag-pol poly protein [Ilyonectria robusta]
MVVRWISYLLLFDFTVRYILGKKNTVADGLLRKGEGPSNLLDREAEGDIKDKIDARLNLILFSPKDKKLEDSYIGEWLVLGNYLTSLKQLEGLSVYAAQRPAEIAKPTTPWYPIIKIYIDG